MLLVHELSCSLLLEQHVILKGIVLSSSSSAYVTI